MNITWQQMSLIWTIIAVSAGGAFAVCSYANDAKVSAYELRIADLERRVQELEKQLEICLKAQDRQILRRPTSPTKPSLSFPTVLITYPKSGSGVEMFDRVEFVVQGQLPPKHVVLLAIRDPIGQWWSWGHKDNGRFPRVQFGEKRDRGESFEARLLITDSPFPRNKPQISLPESVASDSVIVVRK